MKDAEDLLVDLGKRSYHILVGEGLIDNGGALISPLIRQPRTIIVTDKHLEESGHLEKLCASLDKSGIVYERFVLPPGEKTKSLKKFGELADSILKLNIERGTSIVALGGGVIGDLAGFVGATLLRGLDVIQIPTTLLAQVDSSVGGKTGINSVHGKNLIGAFHQPKLVLADVGVLDSLPPRELRAGYAEVVKYGLINRPGFFDWLEQNGQALIAGDREARRLAVIESCRAKAEIVAEDERESGNRALLNLGHTFGHALEAITGYGQELLHGEAIAIGMTLAFKISAGRGHCPEEDAQRVTRHLKSVDLPTSARTLQTHITADAMINAMARDKKVEAGIPRFVLVDGIGKAHAGVEIERSELEAFLHSELD
jgi:3-dehydroquinate synthase